MTEAPVENVTLYGREIGSVLEAWGYQKLADEAWTKLHRDGWHFQVELTVVYPPDSKPRIFGEERLFFTMQQA